MARKSTHPGKTIYYLLIIIACIFWLLRREVVSAAHRNLAAISIVGFDETWPLSARYEWVNERSGMLDTAFSGSGMTWLVEMYQTYARSSAARWDLGMQVVKAKVEAHANPQAAIERLQRVLSSDPRHLEAVFTLAGLYNSLSLRSDYFALRDTTVTLVPEYESPILSDPEGGDAEFLGLDVLDRGALELDAQVPVRLYWRIPLDPQLAEASHCPLVGGTLYRWADRLWWEGELTNLVADAGFERIGGHAPALSEVTRSEAVNGFARTLREHGLTVVEWDYGTPSKGPALLHLVAVAPGGPYVVAMAIAQEGFVDTAPEVRLQFDLGSHGFIHNVVDHVNWNGWRQRSYLLAANPLSGAARLLIKLGQVGSTLMWDDLMLFDVSRLVRELFQDFGADGHSKLVTDLCSSGEEGSY